MMPAQLAVLLLPFLPTAGGDAPELTVELTASRVEFHVSGPKAPFLGGVILSLEPAVCHYFQGLPPLLCDYAVLGVGVGQGSFDVGVGEHLLPPGIPIHSQGVTLVEGAIESTAVVSFVLDGSSVPPSDR